MTEASVVRLGCRCRLCVPQPPADDDERRCLAAVEQHGWQVLMVGAGDGLGEPEFAYTVGLPHRAGHPELVMSGLPHEFMHRTLNHVAQRIVAGRRLETPGEIVEGALANAALVVHAMTPEALAETVTWSGWFHRAAPSAVQLVWPTTGGVYPWQDGAPDILDERQPPGWRVPVIGVGVLSTAGDWPMPAPRETQAFVCSHVLDDGEGICCAAREIDPGGGEKWSFDCGAEDHSDATAIRLVPLDHPVRSAPRLADLADLAIGHRAWRDDLDSPWQRGSIGG